MIINFTYQGRQYLNFDTSSEEWQNLDIPESDKQSIVQQASYDAVIERRKTAYKEEADPLYLEWQYDGTAEKEQAWRDKVAEIKARYPLPGEA